MNEKLEKASADVREAQSTLESSQVSMNKMLKEDQFAFRLTSSTTVALIMFIHQVTGML